MHHSRYVHTVSVCLHMIHAAPNAKQTYEPSRRSAHSARGFVWKPLQRQSDLGILGAEQSSRTRFNFRVSLLRNLNPKP